MTNKLAQTYYSLDNPMTFCIGYDKREDICFKVAKDTLQLTTPAVKICVLVQDNLRAFDFYDRDLDELASTEFSLTRFLVPALSSFKQEWVVFCDCDFLFTRNVVARLLPHLDDEVPLYCVKHDYKPRHKIKMGGHYVQHEYPRKNWSSFMVFNCGHEANRLLTPGVVNAAEPSWLHQMRWLDGYEIGELPVEFNFLVGELDPPEDAIGLMAPTNRTPTCLHYTLGIGVFKPPVQDYANLWTKSQYNYLECKRRVELARQN